MMIVYYITFLCLQKIDCLGEVQMQSDITADIFSEMHFYKHYRLYLYKFRQKKKASPHIGFLGYVVEPVASRRQTCSASYYFKYCR